MMIYRTAPIIVVLFVILNLTVNPNHTTAEAARARRSPSTPSISTSSSSSSEYDKRITTIDPSGRLLQVEYAMEAAHRRSATSAAALLVMEGDDESSSSQSNKKDNSNANLGIMVYISNHQTRRTNDSSSSTTQTTPLHRQKIHRIDSGTLCITSGLDGDGRLLVRHLRAVSNRENHYEGQNGAMCSVRVLAAECGRIQHQLTLTPGARPLGVAVTLMGFLPPAAESSAAYDDGMGCRRPLGLFRCEAGGMTVDSCACTASGIGRDKVRLDLAELLRNLKQTAGGGDGDGVVDDSNDDDGDDDDSDAMEVVTNGALHQDNGSSSRTTTVDFVKGVANIVLKRYLEEQPSSKDNSGLFQNNNGRREGDERTSESSSSSSTNPALVDIYLVKPNPKCRGGVQISCAMSVPECDLDHVADLFAEDVCDFDDDDESDV